MRSEENGAIQFEIRANVTLKEDQFIRAGYSANADIVLEKTSQPVLAIQEGLLNFEGDSIFVEVEVSPQQFEKRYITFSKDDNLFKWSFDNSNCEMIIGSKAL